MKQSGACGTFPGMTTTDHRRTAALAILASAEGPLTAKQIRGRLEALGHGCAYGDAARALLTLVGRGLVETRADTILGTRSRIFWPTQLGRREADSLEEQRIDGV